MQPPAARNGRARRIVLVRALSQLVILGGMVALIIWRTDVSETWAVLRDIRPLPALAGISLLVLSNLAHARKWQDLLKSLGRVTLLPLFAVFWSSMATNNVIPFRAGDFLRVQLLSQRTGIPRAGVVATLLTERLLDAACFLLLFAAGVLLLGISGGWNALVIILFLLFLMGLAATVAAARSRNTDRFLESLPIRWLPARLKDSLRNTLPSFVEGLRPLGDFQTGLTVAGWALLAWLLEVGAFWFFGLTFGLELNPAAYLLVMVATNFAGSITILPANIGLYELTAVGVLSLAGASVGEAAAYAVGSHVLVIVTISGVGLLSLWYLRLGFSDIFYLRSPHPGDPAVAAAPDPSREP